VGIESPPKKVNYFRKNETADRNGNQNGEWNEIQDCAKGLRKICRERGKHITHKITAY